MKSIWIIVLVLIIILSFRLYFFYKNLQEYKTGDRAVFSHTFLNDPSKTSYGVQFFTKNNLQIFLPSEEEYRYGDRINISGIVSEKSFITKNNQLIKRKIIENAKVTRHDNPSFTLALISSIRQNIIGTFYHFLPYNEAGLLIGIIFGIRTYMDKALSEVFRNTGVLHVVAASGTNVSMVGEMILLGLIFFIKRRLAILFTVIGIFFYAFLAGFAPSILRAAIMAAFAYGASFFGRQNYSLLALVSAGFAMVFFQPEVISDIGFQLSFLSTAGIILIKPLIDKMIFRKKVGKKIFFLDDFSTTTAAQASTLPIMLFAFSSYSLIGIIVNPLILWTIPILMLLGGAAAILSIVFPFLSTPFLYLSYPLLLYFETVSKFFSQYSFPLVVENFPITIILGYYCILLSLILFVSKKRTSNL